MDEDPEGVLPAVEEECAEYAPSGPNVSSGKRGEAWTLQVAQHRQQDNLKQKGMGRDIDSFDKHLSTTTNY